MTNLFSSVFLLFLLLLGKFNARPFLLPTYLQEEEKGKKKEPSVENNRPKEYIVGELLLFSPSSAFSKEKCRPQQAYFRVMKNLYGKHSDHRRWLRQGV